MKDKKTCENCKWFNLKNGHIWDCICPDGQTNMNEIKCDNHRDK